jgi:hypothetical protein
VEDKEQLILSWICCHEAARDLRLIQDICIEWNWTGVQIVNLQGLKMWKMASLEMVLFPIPSQRRLTCLLDLDMQIFENLVFEVALKCIPIVGRVDHCQQVG